MRNDSGAALNRTVPTMFVPTRNVAMSAGTTALPKISTTMRGGWAKAKWRNCWTGFESLNARMVCPDSSRAEKSIIRSA